MIKKGLYILAFMLSCFILKAQEEVHQDSLQLHIKSLKQFKNYRSYLQHDLVSCRPRVTYLQFLQTVYNYSKKLDQEEHLITLKALNNSATIKQHFFEGTKYALEYLAHDEVYEKEESFGVLRNLTFCLSSLGLHTEYLFWIEKMNIQSQKFNQNYWTPENPFTLELGTIYYKVGNYKEAIKNYKEAIALKKLYPDTDYVRTAGIYNNVGMCYTKMNQKDSAYFYFDKAMDILKSNPIKNTVYDKDYILNFKNLIRAQKVPFYIQEEQYRKSIVTLTTLLKGIPKDNNYNNHFIETHLELAKIYYLDQQYIISQRHIDSASQLLKATPNANNLMTALSYQEKLHLLNKNFNLAKKAHQKLLVVYDSISKSQNSSAINLAAYKYNLREKESELKNTAALLKKEEQLNLYQSILIIGLCFLSLFIVYFIYKTKKNHTLVSLQKEQISAALNHSELLRKELHHRVKNSLHLISNYWDLQLQNIDDQHTKEVINTGKKHMRAISLVHQLLHYKEQESLVNINDYVEKLIKEITLSNDEINVQIEATAPHPLFNIEKAIPIGLILNELVTNSIKHAFKNIANPQIKVLLEAKEDIFCLTYKDNGIGIPKSQKVEDSKLGFEIIYMLVDEIYGSAKMQNDNGFTFQLHFKKSYEDE